MNSIGVIVEELKTEYVLDDFMYTLKQIEACHRGKYVILLCATVY